MTLRSHRSLYAYVGREYLLSFGVAFLFFFFIFFVNQMLLLAEEILTKRVPLGDVALLILYSLPSIVALSFPFGSLVGALMTVGRFSSDNEIIAFQASGVSLPRLFIPMIALGVVFSLVSFVMNDYFLPLGTINFSRLYRELLYANPELELEPNSIQYYEGSILITGNVSDRNIDDLVILDEDEEGGQRFISAASAELVGEAEDEGVVSLELSDVFSQSAAAREAGSYDYFAASRMVYNILLRDITLSVRNVTAREMSSYDVFQLIREQRDDLEERRRIREREENELEAAFVQSYFRELERAAGGEVSFEEASAVLEGEAQTLRRLSEQPVQSRSLQINLIEFHKKFAIPFACLTFVFLAFPLGLFTKRSGRTVGFGIGLLIAVVYWSLLLAGNTLGIQDLRVPPFWAMWFPNALMLLSGLVLLAIRRVR